MGFFARHEDRAVLDHYRRARQVGRELNEVLIKRIPKKVLTEYARKLGLFHRNVLVLHNENEMASLFDHCLYSYRPGGKSLMQLYIEKTPPPPDSIESAILSSMLSARYSLFSVEKVQKGIGVFLLDILRQDELFIMDIGLASCKSKGFLLAGRVIPIGGAHMSTGALAPLQGDLLETVQSIMKRLFDSRNDDRPLLSTPGEEVAFATQVTRAVIQSGVLEYVGYSGV